MRFGLAALTILSTARPGAAQAPAPAGDPLGFGLGVGTALVILLAVLIAASVAAKLLIVFGAVPRRPQTGFEALVHTLANFVGGLMRGRPGRRRQGTDDR